MFTILILLPILAIVRAVILQTRQWNREFLKFDFVQFMYAFILAPLFFVWLKFFSYYLARSEIGNTLSAGELFIIDTFMSVAMLYVYAFVVIHSLTKSFEIKQKTDPLYNMFAHSEYFHQQFSHFVVYFGTMCVVTLLSVLNLIFPLELDSVSWYKWLTVSGGIATGALALYGIGKFETASVRFHKLMKLSYGLFFTIHVVLYLFWSVTFSVEYAIFWLMTTIYATFVTASFFIEFETYPTTSAKKIVTSVLRHSLNNIKKIFS